ncbi:hypothetical protein [Hymenobacter cheonanensis]|uniref:hypothetical protein n=1 Tax=Hymenobacter sp. CA2-7 TaxID=3063993 RepID=UPI002712CBE8|nr:hypothetical protein [Hymenobacter sp. CA2-7]MDO7886428.1 hypothetical protein [Hymenobacter sp. CA2-7]
MKAYLPLHLAAVLSCSLLASSCQKESDNIKPAASAAVSTNVMPVNHLIYAEVGTHYNHYPVLTGATGYYIPMTMKTLHVTPGSTIEEWVSDDVVPAQYLPLDENNNPVSLSYIFRGGATVGNIVIETKTTWQKNGTVEMHVKSVYN